MLHPIFYSSFPSPPAFPQSLIPALHNTLKTLDHLNYAPKLLPQLKPHLLASVEGAFTPTEGESLSVSAVLSRIELAACLISLGLLSSHHVDFILSSLTTAEVTLEKLPKSFLVKILQLNTHAQLIGLSQSPLTLPALPVFAIPVASSPSTAEKTKETLNRMERFRADVRHYLRAARANGPSKRYLVDGPWLHPSGHVFDAVVVTDSRGNTLPIPDAVVEALERPVVSSILPHLEPDTHAVVLLLFNVFDSTVFTERPLGDKANALRDLRALGFKPCVINLKHFYKEVKTKRTELLYNGITGALEPVA